MNINEIISTFELSDGIEIKSYEEKYFNNIQNLYREEGWMSFIRREDEARKAWQSSQISIVILKENKVIGALRGLTDGNITTYIAEIVISKDMRGKGLGNILLEVCHLMYPRTRIDLISSESADDFYRRNGFREITGFRKSYV